MNKILLSFVFSALMSISFTQEYADKDFYLLDTLNLGEVDEYDRIVIDSILNLYHLEEQDTLRLYYLEKLVENCWDIRVWPRYNQELLVQSQSLRTNNSNEQFLQKMHNFEGIAYGNIAYLYDTKGNPDSALIYYNLAQEQFHISGNRQSQGEILNVIGQLHADQGNYYQGIMLSEQSIEFLDDKEINSAVCFLNVAILHYKQDNYDEALIFYDKAYTIASNLNDKRVMGLVNSDKASVLKEQGYLQEAKELALSALVSFTEAGLKNSYDNIRILNSLANIEFSLGHMKMAKFYNQEIMTAARKNESVYSLNIARQQLGDIAIKEGDYNLAEEFAIQALEYGRKQDNIVLTANTLDILVQVEEHKGAFKNAFIYQKELLKLRAQAYNEFNKEASIKQSVQFQYDKQKELDDLVNQQALALSEEQKQRTRLGLLATAVIAGLIALFSIFIFNRLKLIRKQKKELDSAYEQLEESKKNELAVSNLKALQSQMNPHFIFNALNSVQDLVLLQDIRNSNKYLGKFSDLIRKILLSSKEQFISLAEEVEILSLYLDLEKLRFGEDFEIDLKCSVSEEKQDEIKLPAMFIQPYIENAIKHGLFHKEGVKKLIVHFNLITETTLECIVEDNGIGQKQAAVFKEKRLHLHTGFSTEAINERIRLLNETLDKKIVLEIEDLLKDGKAAGTKIRLIFPI